MHWNLYQIVLLLLHFIHNNLNYTPFSRIQSSGLKLHHYSLLYLNIKNESAISIDTNWRFGYPVPYRTKFAVHLLYNRQSVPNNAFEKNIGHDGIHLGAAARIWGVWRIDWCRRRSVTRSPLNTVSERHQSTPNQCCLSVLAINNRSEI